QTGEQQFIRLADETWRQLRRKGSGEQCGPSNGECRRM
ncbi:hypothetical protein ACQWF3_24470, partial [Salmonella enterica subsp. enterica serovar Infantis]